MEIDPSKINPPAAGKAYQSKDATANINELQLKTARTYSAEVIKPIETAPHQHKANHQNTVGVIVPESSTSSQNNANLAAQEAVKNWLIRLNGKLVEIKSAVELQAGQKINLSLGSQSTLATSPTSNQHQSMQQIALILQATSSASTGKTNEVTMENTASPQQLMSTLSRLLNEQVGLQSAFRLLNNLNQTAITQMETNIPNAQTSAPVSRALADFFAKLPHLQTLNHAQQSASGLTPKTTDTINSAPTSTSPQTPSVVKDWLNQSGLFLEKSLLSSGSVNTLRAILDAASPNTQNTISPSPTLASQSSLSDQALARTLDSIGSNQRAAGTTNTSGLTSNSQPLATDLKSNLIKLVTILSSASKATPTTHADSAQPSLLNELISLKPFDFPLAPAPTQAKVQSILADQELSIGQLLKLAASMLNRIQFNQLNSLFQSQTAEGAQTQSLFFELPVINHQNNVDVINLRVDQREEKKQGQENDEDKRELQWKLSLTFDLEGLGPMYIQVVLTPPSISSTIWAEQTETYELALKESTTLHSKLEELGLDVGDICCQHGMPAKQETSISQNLVDIEA